MSRRLPWFPLAVLAMLLLGGVLRVQAGWLDLYTGSTVRTAAPGEVPVGLRETALDFYRLVDKGQYADAYALALENKWQPGADRKASVAGLASKDEFVGMLDEELGANGMALNIVSIDLAGASPLPEAGRTPDRYPELDTLRFLPDELRIDAVYQAELGGTLLGRCSRWDWRRVVLLGHVRGTDAWRVLLPGRKTSASPHYEEWFLDRKS